ncbi:hypothetical protein M426DRAFT_23247 [Hypoxylon sp. CI-4A]|nr:hypothetical protein M426DRAFT_23247 [Hypoxylon sp. CI-4A]
MDSITSPVTNRKRLAGGAVALKASKVAKKQRVTKSPSGAVATPNADGPEGNSDHPNGDKPEPQGVPPVWADKRGAVCDALSCFRAHQSSLYSKDGMILGALLNREGGAREYIDSKVIITDIGGGRVLDKETGLMIRTEDQDESNRAYKILERAYKGHLAFVVIVGADNKVFPVKLYHQYNILGHFHITDLWSEVTIVKDIQITIYRVRLEKVDLATPSWWTPKGASAHDAGEFDIGQYACVVKKCPRCGSNSKEKFKQGWACLQKKCTHFFKFPPNISIDKLEYNDTFLRERSPFDGEPVNHNLVPALPSRDMNSSGSEKEFKRGIVCPKCLGCSRRIKWDGWYCETPGCDFKLIMPLRLITLEAIVEENERAQGPKHPDVVRYIHNSVLCFKEKIGECTTESYFFPDGNGGFIGSVTSIHASKEMLSRPGGINDLYEKIQRGDIPLERRAAKNAFSSYEELISHFACNYGAPYKFGVVVKTTSGFQDAPGPILETLKRITWGGEAAVEKSTKLIEKENINVPDNAIPADFEPYNELLILGYFENSKISAHDDGEKELGPNVASLSLGSPSVMHFMPKKGVNVGNTKDIDQKHRKPILSILLKHGDLLVMHGERIQKLYVHSVIPQGKHRFALTCRFIRPETIPDQEQAALAVTNGKLPAEWDNIRYDGETDRFRDKRTGEITSCPDAGEYIVKLMIDECARTEAFFAHIHQIHNENVADPDIIARLPPAKVKVARDFTVALHFGVQPRYEPKIPEGTRKIAEVDTVQQSEPWISRVEQLHDAIKIEPTLLTGLSEDRKEAIMRYSLDLAKKVMRFSPL